MARTANRYAVFATDADCALFLEVLGTLPERFGVRIHGWALMPNHYHLLMECPRGNLGQAMRHLGLVFTQAYNRANRREGALWRGRSSNRVVLDDAYWRFLLAYLHLNPVKAGLARLPEHCVWTSHAQYIGVLPADPWLTTADMLAQFGGSESLHAYVMDVHMGRDPTAMAFSEEALWKGPSTDRVQQTESPPLRSMEAALTDVAALFDVTPEKVLRGSSAPRANLPRWLAAWWMTDGTNASQRAVAQRMGISRGRVSQMRKRLIAEAANDAAVAEHMAHLRQLAAKG